VKKAEGTEVPRKLENLEAIGIKTKVIVSKGRHSKKELGAQYVPSCKGGKMHSDGGTGGGKERIKMHLPPLRPGEGKRWFLDFCLDEKSRLVASGVTGLTLSRR